MNKITTIQKYAILWLNSQNNPIETIAAELKLTTKQIKNVIDKYTQKTINEQASPDSMGQNKQQSKLKDLMITDSASAKYKVAIMTKAASEVADASKKINIPTSLNKPYIFKPSN